MNERPGIIEIIGARIALRKAGREMVGICPFHDDRHPSLFVNPEKQVFLCRSCQAAGDVFAFVMMIDGLTFPQAKAALGIHGERKPRPVMTPGRQRAAELAAAWSNEQRAKFNTTIADAMALRDDADEIGAFDVADVVDREIIILRGFYESLEYPKGAVEMLALRPSIEQITDGARVTL